MWNPIDSQVRRWARERSSILRHHLTPNGQAIAGLQAAGVPENTIDALYPCRWEDWKAGAYPLVERGAALDSQPSPTLPLPPPQRIFRLVKNHYAAVREIAIVLGRAGEHLEFCAAWWSVSGENLTSPTLLQDSLALYGLTAHMMATADRLDLSYFMRPEDRWNINFPSYELAVDGLCSALVAS